MVNYARQPVIPAALKKLRMPPDTWERHSAIATLSGPAETVLDVGGIRGELSLFMPGAEITTINMAGEDADAYFDGDRLPFADDSFEVAVSLDVLEHIPFEARQKHFDELARVARRKVLICCPLGSPEHVAAEAELADWHLQTTGSEHRFLAEHLETGLPEEDELRSLAASTGLPFRIHFQGDFRKVNHAFRKSTALRSDPGAGTALSYARVRLDPRRHPDLQDESSVHTNRAIVSLEATASTALL